MIIEATPKVLKTLLKLSLMTITVNTCFLWNLWYIQNK